MMTNVDFEGLNDWTDEELIEATKAIKCVMERRKNQKIRDIVDKIETDFKRLIKIDNNPDFDFGDFDITAEQILNMIKYYYREAY